MWFRKNSNQRAIQEMIQDGLVCSQNEAQGIVDGTYRDLGLPKLEAKLESGGIDLRWHIWTRHPQLREYCEIAMVNMVTKEVAPTDNLKLFEKIAEESNS